ncbi:hypothetical protein [Methylomonas methanica]|uniref:Uncharacterized protein n=1 Tax=Methylomonas methanica (strain DSM 25384 / MC09) TaxID=857087 RepID=G0A218_METMM|nr:hypothetical protein [Methylomonas methanica]AEG02561.1 hypothetical protein Metme_4210 [Methylomonas methanica MC09]
MSDILKDELLDGEIDFPAKLDSREALKKERNYRTAISSSNYLKLERESTQRGVKPFTLTKSVMTLYVNRQLIYIRDLPESLQEQIREFYKSEDKALVS